MDFGVVETLAIFNTIVNTIVIWYALYKFIESKFNNRISKEDIITTVDKTISSNNQHVINSIVRILDEKMTQFKEELKQEVGGELQQIKIDFKEELAQLEEKIEKK